MYRKADRDKLYDISGDTLYAKEMLRTIATQLKALSDGQDKLMQSHAALEKLIEARLPMLTREDVSMAAAKAALSYPGFKVVNVKTPKANGKRK